MIRKKSKNLEEMLYQEMLKTPTIDIHTHLKLANPSANNLYDILSYHFVVADLESAGIPREKWQSERIDVKERVANMIHYLEVCQNTGTYQCLKNLLTDLYGIENPLSEENWGKTYNAVLEKTKDKQWPNKVLKNYANIQHVVVDYGHGFKENKSFLDPKLYSYTREEGFLVSDYSLIEQVVSYIGHRPASADVIDRSIEAYISESMPKKTKSIVLSVPAYFRVREFGKGEVNRVLSHERIGYSRDLTALSENDRLILFSYMFHQIMKVCESMGIHVVMSIGCRWDFYNDKTVSTLNNGALQNIADVAQRYKKINFFIISCSYPLNQDLSIITKMLPNVIATGYWWHSMYPEYIGKTLKERLDIIPMNKILGFFSDAYMVEWVYGKLSVVRKETARILAEKIERGYYTEDLAVDIIRKIFYENPQNLYLNE